MTTTGTAVIAFGSTPSNDATVTVTGQTGILTTSFVEAWVQENVTSGDNLLQDHRQLAWSAKLSPQNIIAGTGFDIEVMLLIGLVTGTFKINWVWT